MSFESDVNEDVKANIRGHVRWYVEHYLPDPNVARYDPHIAKEQAEIRGQKIEREQSWWSQDSHDSARLKVIEYLDSHPSAKQQGIDYVRAIDRAAEPPSFEPRGADSDGAAILREQLHRLEGGFLVAVVQNGWLQSSTWMSRVEEPWPSTEPTGLKSVNKHGSVAGPF
jgi:hypothetical protein